MSAPRKTMVSQQQTSNILLNNDTPPTFLLPDPGFPTPELFVRPDWKYPRTELPHIPGYEPLEMLGRGGMGIVFKARQQGLNRLVALKLILTGEQAGKEELARFFQEAEAVGALQHPNIVQVYEIGQHEGRHYLSLEYVDGGNLDQRIQKSPQPVSFAAGICETIARAIHAVHSIQIVHRDLKPANILLQHPSSEEAKQGSGSQKNPPLPIVKVADFGLAKRFDTDQHLTQTGWIAGTPTYMAPEQVRGDRHRIGPSSDIWAIGIILYEMLTGRPPFQGDSTAKTMAEVLKVNPEVPSRLVPGIPLDLETICLKCLEKESNHRYATALELAEDLERYRTGRPIAARRITLPEQAWRWCNRNRLIASLLATILLSLVVGTTVATLYALQADNLREKAENNAQESQQKTIEALEATEAAIQARAEEARQRKIANEETRKAYEREELGRRERYALDANLSMMSWQVGELQQVQQFLDRYIPKAGATDLRGFEWYYLSRLMKAEQETIPLGKRSQGIALFLEGEGIAYGQEKNVCFHVLNCIGTPRLCEGHTDAVSTLATNPNTDEIASASLDGTVRIWDPLTGTTKWVLRGQSEQIFGVAYTPDGKNLISWGGKNHGPMKPGEVGIWDADTGRMKHSLQKHHTPVEGVTISGDGKTLISCGGDGLLNFHEIETGKLLRSFKTGYYAVSIAIPPQQKKWLALGMQDGTVALIDSETGVLLREISAHSSPITCLLFSPDGMILYSAGYDNMVRMWDARRGTLIRSNRGHEGIVTAITFKRSPRYLASVGLDGYARVWDTLKNPEHSSVQTPFTLDSLHLAPNEKLYGVGMLGELASWSTKTNQWTPIDNPSMPHYRITDSILLPDGETLVLVAPGIISYLNLKGAKLHPVLEKMTQGVHFAVSPIMRWVAVSHTMVEVHLQDLNQPYQPKKIKLNGLAKALALSPGEEPLLAVAHTNGLSLFSMEGRSIKQLPLQTGKENADESKLAFSPDGKLLAATDKDHRVHLWEVASGTELWCSETHYKPIESVSFSPKGDRILTCSMDNTIKLLDPITGYQTLVLRGDHKGVTAACFTADGSAILSAGINTQVFRWEGGPVRPKAPAP